MRRGEGLSWFDEAKALHQQGLGYRRIAKELNKSVKTVESRFLKWKRQNGTEQKPLPLEEAILLDLKKGCNFEYLCEKHNKTKRVIEAVIEDIREQGYSIVEIGGTIKINRALEVQHNEYDRHWTGDKIIRFGVVSDTHLCNKWQQLTFLNDIYDTFSKEGITTVYHAGDIADGYYKNRPGHIYEIFKVGADEQAQYVIDHYPKREGIVTEFITGNHDHTHIMNGGADIGKQIAMARPDMVYLGQANARVNITPNCTVEMNHPLDGTAYAISYSIQKYIESYGGGDKPNILLNGHHHKALYIFYRNVHAFECGALEAQTPWMKGKRIPAHIGGWIVEVHVDGEGTITRCKGEFIPLYKAVKDDY